MPTKKKADTQYSTLFTALEFVTYTRLAGLLAVKDWSGDSISVRTWEDARDIACLIGGVNPASKSVYS